MSASMMPLSEGELKVLKSDKGLQRFVSIMIIIQVILFAIVFPICCAIWGDKILF